MPEKTRNSIRSFVELISKYASSANSPHTSLAKMTEMLMNESGYIDFLKNRPRSPTNSSPGKTE